MHIRVCVYTVHNRFVVLFVCCFCCRWYFIYAHSASQHENYVISRSSPFVAPSFCHEFSVSLAWRSGRVERWRWNVLESQIRLECCVWTVSFWLNMLMFLAIHNTKFQLNFFKRNRILCDLIKVIGILRNVYAFGEIEVEAYREINHFWGFIGKNNCRVTS